MTSTRIRFGATDALSWRVDGSLQNGELAPAQWERMRQLQAEFTADDEGVSIRELRGNLGGGALRGRADLRYATDDSSPSIRATLSAERALLVRSADLLARGSGELTLSGTVAAPRLAGSLQVTRGIYLRNVYPSLEAGAALPFDLFRFDSGFAAALGFDVELRLAGGFKIRNNRVEVAPHGRLHLGGNGRQPVLTGDVTSTSGEIRLPHLTIRIDSVQVRFPEENPFEPTVELAGRGSVRGVEIQARAQGPLTAPEVAFSSTPYLPQEELLALIATGLTPTQLRQQGFESIAAVELLRLYGPQVWESVFGSSRGRGLLETVEISTSSAESAGNVDQYRVKVGVYDWLDVAAERDRHGEINLDVVFVHWLR